MPTFCKRTSPPFARSCLRNEVVMKCLAWVAARSSDRAVAAPPSALKMLLRAYLQFIARLARSASQVAESCRRSEANVVDMLRAVSKISVATSRVIREMSQGKEVPFLQMPTAPVDVGSYLQVILLSTTGIVNFVPGTASVCCRLRP
ncbi:MAG: hypothetical protein KVP17_003518 [Porospora cf. gigantea B]|uniref:uncharacterized protein n=1 Tax=Porospora cf. gigantea B TaxID=2853592 RepID=UPI0035719F80|nr:MAG: hypothetical protein KVP17_003518 [Porospora cf. gigantea B]